MVRITLASVILSLSLSLSLAAPLSRRGGYSGDGTFYQPGLGSCGKRNDESDMIAALSSSLMSQGDYCGKEITVEYGGKSVDVTIVDSCPGCNEGDMDLSPAAFSQLASFDKGRIPIKWSL
ncbi:RlpA-like double-psi beta-barrel-protein domain-containing protein-containing protein [Phycomyces nitens]|nr:RlpA-like double-psi beta-barrel-protein domain-containing protein-containing protein [Phycomyces nitens]